MTGDPSAHQTEGRISVEAFNALMAQTVPLAAYLGIRAERIGAGEAWSRLAFSPTALRPGGTHSGPALMALADMCMYAAVLGAIGNDPRPLTTRLEINFLRRPPACDLIARCTLLSCDGKRASGSIVIYPEGEEAEVLCTSTGIYALPRSTSAGG